MRKKKQPNSTKINDGNERVYVSIYIRKYIYIKIKKNAPEVSRMDNYLRNKQ